MKTHRETDIAVEHSRVSINRLILAVFSLKYVSSNISVSKFDRFVHKLVRQRPNENIQ